mmetsp:Transcript_15251/g.22484  ORF Transcript_15251/g.22484 Transcript_15251/m.22484 type:complete len:253 (+) Transcript_15251:208-966(+)|eukprot:CAMPEP_0194213864 /NCGR_PEP_ID=MMETSP0156-20130528/14742_1 /TAXON_ID=33649 /ORGANISM="Thalassionema nitzschioides, Strain L26-B" /LENGTH=252 /DNA_ID=CAMNT_0038941997 /DNA_START=126 /DNA_END=884 /DNA_ORIENTATION=-
MSESQDDVGSQLPSISAKPSNLFYRYFLNILHSLDFTQWTLKELIFGFFAVVGAVLSVGILFFDAVILMDFVAILCILFGFSTVFMQRTLTDLETMRELNQKAREQVKRLQENNNLLAEENQKLEASGKKLKEAEASLAKISIAQGMNLETLIKQVEDYKKIQENVKESVKDQILQTLVSAVMNSDMDHDYVIGPNEMGLLCARLKGIPMVKFNEEKFTAAMNEVDGSILQFSKHHLTDDVALKEEGIFLFE